MARSHKKQREWKILSRVMANVEKCIDQQQEQVNCHSNLGHRDLTPYNAIERLPRNQNIII